MQTSKWTLAILLATCCTFPVMGLDASTSGMKTISKEGTMAQVHTGKHSPQHQEKGQKGVRKFYGRIVKTKVIVGGPIRTIRWPRPVRKIERAPINIKEKTPEELQRAVAEAVRKHEQEKAAQAAQQQSADFCEKNCRALRDDEMYDAEIALQQIRETTDPTASFEKYPWLMYEHSDKCQYSKQQPLPGNGSENMPTPQEN